MSALRVGLFTECYRPIQNGIVASVDALADELRARGHEALVVTPEMPDYCDGERPVVRLPSLPLPTRTAYRLTVPYLPRALGALSIVHTHSPFVTGWLGARSARRARVPLVFTYHTQLEAYAHYVPFEARATRGAATRLTRLYANVADAVVVPTQTMRRHLLDLGVRAHIEVSPTGIDVARFARGERDDALRARLGVRDGRRMLLSVGRLGREKNVELAIEAFARLDDPLVQLVIVGDGTHRETLERYARRLGVAARTTFAREFARDDLPDTYASADAFVFTSQSETQGLVLVEALASRAPIVAVDTPQTRDVLAEAGTIVPGDASAVAAALRRTLAGDVAAQPAGAAERYGVAAFADRMLALYDELLAPVSVAALALG